MHHGPDLSAVVRVWSMQDSCSPLECAWSSRLACTSSHLRIYLSARAANLRPVLTHLEHAAPSLSNVRECRTLCCSAPCNGHELSTKEHARKTVVNNVAFAQVTDRRGVPSPKDGPSDGSKPPAERFVPMLQSWRLCIPSSRQSTLPPHAGVCSVLIVSICIMHRAWYGLATSGRLSQSRRQGGRVGIAPRGRKTARPFFSKAPIIVTVKEPFVTRHSSNLAVGTPVAVTM
jgi:hypothetical protein